MGNFKDCQCKCRDNKHDGEVNLPTNKTNIKEINNGNNNDYNKNLKTLFKRNPNQITDDNENKNEKEKENNIFKEKDEYFDGISEIQLNDIENTNNNDNQKMSENTNKRKKIKSNNDLINNDNSDNKKNIKFKTFDNDESFQKEKNNINRQKTFFENTYKNFKQDKNQKITYDFNRTKTTTTKDFQRRKNFNKEINNTNNSINEKDSSYFSQFSEFNTSTCKDFLDKYHLICTQSTTKIGISKIINHINLINNDSNDVLFHSNLNRVQLSGDRIINKKYIGRFLLSTKKEIRIFSSKEKFITLQNPIQIFSYNEMKRSCMVEFDLGKKNIGFDTTNDKNSIFHFMIYFENETFEVFSGEHKIVEKWITLINYLIDNQFEINN